MMSSSDGRVAPETGQPATAPPSAPVAERKRFTAARAAVLLALVLLVLLLVFILQNSQKVTVHFLGTSGRLSLGVALLFAALAGAVIAGIVAVARIAQLKLRARRRRHA